MYLFPELDDKKIPLFNLDTKLLGLKFLRCVNPRFTVKVQQNVIHLNRRILSNIGLQLKIKPILVKENTVP